MKQIRMVGFHFYKILDYTNKCMLMGIMPVVLCGRWSRDRRDGRGDRIGQRQVGWAGLRGGAGTGGVGGDRWVGGATWWGGDRRGGRGDGAGTQDRAGHHDAHGCIHAKT